MLPTIDRRSFDKCAHELRELMHKIKDARGLSISPPRSEREDIERALLGIMTGILGAPVRIDDTQYISGYMPRSAGEADAP